MAELAKALPPEEERGPPGNVRPFSHGFMAAAFTFGLYAYYWHHATHDELARYLGRPNRLQFVWLAHILLIFMAVVFVFAVLVPAGMEYHAEEGPFLPMLDQPQQDEARPMPTSPAEGADLAEPRDPTLGSFLRDTGLDVPVVLLGGAIWLTFAAYVIGQYMLLYQYRPDANAFAGAAGFLLLVGFAQVGNFLSPYLLFDLLMVGLVVVAYFNLQAAYNEFWAATGAPQVEGQRAVLQDDLVARAQAACSQCGGPVSGSGTPGGELIVPCASCGWRNALRLGAPA